MKKLITVLLILTLALQLVSCELLDAITGGVKEIRETTDEIVRTTAEQAVDCLANNRQDILGGLFCTQMQEDDGFWDEIEALFAPFEDCSYQPIENEIIWSKDFSSSGTTLSYLTFFVEEARFVIEREDEDGNTVTEDYILQFDLVTVCAEDETLIGLHRLSVTNTDTNKTLTVGNADRLPSGSNE